MTDHDLTPAEAAERHADLVMCGALDENSPLTEIEPRQIPNSDAIWPGDGRTTQEHYNEGVERFIAAKAAGRRLRLDWLRETGDDVAPDTPPLDVGD